MGYNSVCIKDFREIFAPIEGFSGMTHRMLPIAFSLNRPPLPWQRNLGQNGLWLGLRKRFLQDFCKIFAPIGGFRGWAIKSCQFHFPRPTPVAMATKFETKIRYNSACAGDFCKIFAPVGGFSRMGYRMLPIAFSPIDPRCHGNEIWDKMGYNSACVGDFLRFLRLGL